MRILQVNKFLYLSGGVERVLFATIDGLRERGHTVSEFAMTDVRNRSSDYAKYFASPLPALTGKLSWPEQAKIFIRLFYSPAIESRLRALVKIAQPEIAHLHNTYHQLSASTFTTLNRAKIPMVMSLHTMFPFCPNQNLMHGETMGEDLYNKKLYNCVRYRCVENRLLPSIAGTLEAYYYRYRGLWKMVERFICPSEFMRDKMMEYGFPSEKLRLIRYPVVVPTNVKEAPLGKTILYFGRVHVEKGIKIFMEAVRDLKQYEVVIAGSGPADAWTEQYIKENNLTHVKKIGWVGGSDWANVLNQARVVVIPSVFYETSGGSVTYEVLAWGRLVVASNRGPLPEIIKDGQTGFLARPEDPVDLKRVIIKAMELPEREAQVIIQRGKTMIEEDYNNEDYFAQLLSVYKEVLANR